MHRTTRRLKRFKRPASSRSFADLLPKTNGPPSHLDVLNQGNPSTSRHRRVVPFQLDPLRSVMLVAIIVITIVLYLALWELERSSFASVPKESSNLNPDRTTISQLPVAVNSERILEMYPVVGAQDESASHSIYQPDPLGGRLNASSTDNDLNRLPPKAGTWPPHIARVPDDEHAENFEEIASFRTNKYEDPPSSLSDSLDVAYCNGTCRFLLPVRVGEQESKARLHFTQLLKLSQRLNRTLVLPHVGKSRMSACSKWPFEAYYDTKALPSGLPGLPTTMNLSMFMKWIEERPGLPSAFFVSMDSPPKDHWRALGSLGMPTDLPFLVEESGVDSKVLSCLEAKLPRLRSSVPGTALSVLFGSSSFKMHPNTSNHLIQLLSGRLDTHASDFDLMTGPGHEYPHPFTESPSTRGSSFTDINVLVIDYDLRYPLFAHSDSDPHFNLHYAPALYDLADRISDNLGAFIGVHWRMENVPVENLAWCAASLVSTLHSLLRDEVMGKKVRHVWLATDYPLPLVSTTKDEQLSPDGARNENARGTREHPLLNYGPRKKSSTFKSISPEHEDAMEMFTEAFQPGGDLDSWKLTDLGEQLRWYPYVEGKFNIDETLLDDSGVFGILDKLVVVQARAFVSGSPECSKTSSFSRQVIEARQESFEAYRGRNSVRNVVEYFGK